MKLYYLRFFDLHSKLEQYQRYLSPDEITRAKKFYHVEDQQRFILARGSLRVLLATYLKIDPEDVEFSYGEKEKPYLANQACQFNLSHTKEALLIGMTEYAQIGVDLELMTRDIDIDGLAKHAFSEIEQGYVASFAGEQKNKAFFRCWARKEALLKAIGIGISTDLNAITATVNEEEKLRVNYGNQVWQVQDLPSHDQHCLAFAVQGNEVIFSITNLKQSFRSE